MVFSITKMKKDKYKYVALELKRAGKFLKKNRKVDVFLIASYMTAIGDYLLNAEKV